MALGVEEGRTFKAEETACAKQLGISLLNSMWSHCLGTEAHATQNPGRQ